MAGNGKFINKTLQGERLELFIGLDSEWLSYADGDAQSYTIVIATPKEFDEETGVLTLENTRGQIFYMHEDTIQMFWIADSGFKLIENTTSTIRTGKSHSKNRDIM
jgi:hypothetical protein